MALGRHEEGGADIYERDTDEVVILPELTEEAEERILAKIRASIGEENDDGMEDIKKGTGHGPCS